MKTDNDKKQIEAAIEKVLEKYEGQANIDIRRILAEELLTIDDHEISGRFTGAVSSMNYRLKTESMSLKLRHVFSQEIDSPEEMIEELVAFENIPRPEAFRTVLTELLIAREELVAEGLKEYEQLVRGGEERFRKAEADLMKRSLKHGLKSVFGEDFKFDESLFNTLLERAVSDVNRRRYH